MALRLRHRSGHGDTTAVPGTVVRITYESPLGPLRLAASRHGLQSLRFNSYSRSSRGPAATKDVGASDAHGHLHTARAWLDAYFAGEPLPPPPPLVADATPVQQRVWAELDRVGPGQTIGYGALAGRLRLPTAPVVAAVAANPVAIIRGCHRVFGWEGDSVGYRGGLRVKRWLMLHEQAAYT